MFHRSRIILVQLLPHQVEELYHYPQNWRLNPILCRTRTLSFWRDQNLDWYSYKYEWHLNLQCLPIHNLMNSILTLKGQKYFHITNFHYIIHWMIQFLKHWKKYFITIKNSQITHNRLDFNLLLLFFLYVLQILTLTRIIML